MTEEPGSDGKRLGPGAGKGEDITARLLSFSFFAGEKGAILIAIIIGITLVASVGTAIVSYYSSSTASQVGAYDASKAYYLAEAGGRYAIQQIVNLEYTANTPGTASTADRNALVAALNNRTFSLSSEGRFTLALAFANDIYTLSSTGIPNSGTLRTNTYKINVYVPPGGSSGVDIPFDTSRGTTLNPNNWNVTGGTHSDARVSNSTLDLTPANGNLMVSLDTDNNCGGGSGTLPADLEEVWGQSQHFLTYEIKVKIQFLHITPHHDDLDTGIAFRLNTGTDKTSMADDNFYAVSYLLYKATSGPYRQSNGPSMWNTFFSNKSQSDFTSDTAYIVLWKQTCHSCGGHPTRTVLQMTNVTGYGADPVGGQQAYLIVRVKEQQNDARNGRENLIAVYVTGDNSSNGIRTKYTNWNYDDTAPRLENVTWGDSNDCIWIVDDNDPNYSHCWVSDSTFTTENYTANCANFPDEIGLFAIGPEEAAMDDLGIRLNFNALQPIDY